MAASISATLIPCLRLLNQIQGLCEQLGDRSEQDVSLNSWTDELGRLRVWAANIGAHQTGQSSLEFRLRDASHISQQITRLLKDLESILNDVKDELSNGTLDHAAAIVFSDDEEPCCEDEAFMSELQQLHGEVVNIVDCLYKMSMLIRRPAQHDMLVGSHKSDAAAFEPFDRDHVRNKFSNADETTIQRLGHAITQRRKYLKYRDRHRAKLGKGMEEVQGIGGMQRAATQTTLSETVATGFQNQNIDFDETSSNSGVSQTSYSPSLMDGGSITIPPLPRESIAGKPFECPYCFFLIEVSGTRSWSRHIFRDIKPYVCISSDCRTPNKLFDSRREWSSHLTTNHDTENLTCPLCRETLSSMKQYERHLARHLEELALFALPRGEMDDEADGDDLDAKGSASGSRSFPGYETDEDPEGWQGSLSTDAGPDDSAVVSRIDLDDKAANNEFIRSKISDAGIEIPEPIMGEAEAISRHIESLQAERVDHPPDVKEFRATHDLKNELPSGKQRAKLDRASLDPSKPTYMKAKRKHLAPETLDHYELPWEWDDVCSFWTDSNARVQYIDKLTAL